MLKPITHLFIGLLFSITLLVSVVPPVHAQGGGEIQYGDSITDEFSSSGVHSWVFQGQADDIILVTLLGNNFAVELTLQQPNGEIVEGVTDEDPNLATLQATLSEDGEYRIFAATADGNTNGAYSLTLINTNPDPITGTIVAELLDVEGVREGTDTEYPFDAFLGDTVMISMTSTEFDTFVELRDPEGNIIAADDDGGIGLNSMIVLTIPVDGTYNVVARAYNDEDGGAYTISVVVFDPTTLRAGDAVVVTSESRPTVFAINAEAEQAVSLIVRTLDFDPIVSVRSPDGSTLAANDDFDNNMDSFLETTLNAEGLYFVVVESYDTYEIGTYTIGFNADEETILAVTEGTEVTDTEGETIQALPINYGDQIDSQLDGEEKGFAFTGTAEDAIVIEMFSNNLDAYVQLLDENGELVGEDDDSGQAFNARLEITLPADGTYTIIATVRIGNPVGTFTLRLSKQE